LEEIDRNSMNGQLTNVRINHGSRILTEKLERMKNDQVIALTIISGYVFISKGVATKFGTNRSYSRCFQVLGFDVLLDQEANPYLLEVIDRPSLDPSDVKMHVLCLTF
jgi:hypothetical protein